MRIRCKGFVSLIEGPFLEAILNTEQDLASCGRGSQPWTREVRGNDCRVLWPGCEELSLQPSAQMPKGEASVPGSESAKVERRKASAPRLGARRALPSAAVFAPFGAPPSLIRVARKLQDPGAAAPRERASLFDIVGR